MAPSGAGKSSLFDALSGFVRPSAGTVRFDGRELTTVAERYRPAPLPPNPAALPDRLTHHMSKGGSR